MGDFVGTPGQDTLYLGVVESSKIDRQVSEMSSFIYSLLLLARHLTCDYKSDALPTELRQPNHLNRHLILPFGGQRLSRR